MTLLVFSIIGYLMHAKGVASAAGDPRLLILGSSMENSFHAEHDDPSRFHRGSVARIVDLAEYCCVNAVLLPAWTA